MPCTVCGIEAGMHYRADGGLWYDAEFDCWRWKIYRAWPDLTCVPFGLECVTVRQAGLFDSLCNDCERSVKS